MAVLDYVIHPAHTCSAVAPAVSCAHSWPLLSISSSVPSYCHHALRIPKNQRWGERAITGAASSEGSCVCFVGQRNRRRAWNALGKGVYGVEELAEMQGAEEAREGWRERLNTMEVHVELSNRERCTFANSLLIKL